MRLLTLPMLHLLWLLPLLVAILVYSSRARLRDMQKIVAAPMLQRLVPDPKRSRRTAKTFLLLTGIAFLIFSLCRPVWNEKEITIKRHGRDVVFLLDVSRSMQADDLKPNRLERAKLAIADCIEVLNGDRVALVVFAGEAKVLCPLTIDYGFFRLMLDGATPDAVNKGGTLMGDAIRTVMDEVFDDQAKEYRDIVLITDGEDHESFPVEAAKNAAEKNIRCIIVGLGDEKEGRRIPVIDEDGKRTFLRYNGQEIWTKLDGATLRQMAATSPAGRYLPVATGAIDLGKVYRDLIATAKKREIGDQTISRYEEKFQIFLGIALFLFFLETILPDWKKVKGEA